MTKDEEVKAWDELCDYIEKSSIRIVPCDISHDNVFSVLGIIGKEVYYCKALLYLISNYWKSFEKDVLNGCCDGEELIKNESEHFCAAPCGSYGREGRIDIYLETENHQTAIEVKIDARDQEHQLIRYQTEMKNGSKSKKTPHLFYLTVDGRTPSDNSLKCSKCERRCSVEEYGVISFREEILKWLRSVSNESNERNVVLEQFSEVLEMDSNQSKKLCMELLEKDPDYLNIARSVSDALPDLWKKIREAFFTSISDLLTEQYGFEKAEPFSFPKEICDFALVKNDRYVYICYQTNLFLRIGKPEKNEWTYISKECFDRKVQKEYETKTKYAVCMTKFDRSNEGLVKWYYKKDNDDGNAIIKTVAESVNHLFETYNPD